MAVETASESFQTGDILFHHTHTSLSSPKTWKSFLIRKWGGCDFNHASFLLDPGTLAEAVPDEDLREADVPQSLAVDDYVDVYRLEPQPERFDAVVEKAREYLQRREAFAYDQIVFLAVLALARRIRLPPGWARTVRRLVDAAAARLYELIRAHAEREPMVCSEFVYRCFNEADPAGDDMYTLRVGADARPDASGGRPPGEESAPVASERLLDAVLRARRGRDGRLDSARRFRAFEATVRPEALADQVRRDVEELSRVDEDRWTTVDWTAELAQDDGELLASIDRFVVAYVTVKSHRGKADVSTLSTLEGDLEQAYDLFVETVADFVTPLDLLKSPDVDRASRWRSR